jgi:hypothetical protein
MSTKRWAVAAGCALVAAVVLWLTLFRASEEDRINATLRRLVKAVMVKEGDNVISRTARIKSELREAVDDDVRVDVPDLGIRVTGRQALVEKAAQAGLFFSSADCELVGSRIQIDESATTAKVDTTAVFTGVRGGERRVDRRDVHLILRKDGDWRVTTIDVRAAAD